MRAVERRSGNVRNVPHLRPFAASGPRSAPRDILKHGTRECQDAPPGGDGSILPSGWNRPAANWGSQRAAFRKAPHSNKWSGQNLSAPKRRDQQVLCPQLPEASELTPTVFGNSSPTASAGRLAPDHQNAHAGSAQSVAREHSRQPSIQQDALGGPRKTREMRQNLFPRGFAPVEVGIRGERDAGPVLRVSHDDAGRAPSGIARSGARTEWEQSQVPQQRKAPPCALRRRFRREPRQALAQPVCSAEEAPESLQAPSRQAGLRSLALSFSNPRDGSALPLSNTIFPHRLDCRWSRSTWPVRTPPWHHVFSKRD